MTEKEWIDRLYEIAAACRIVAPFGGDGAQPATAQLRRHGEEHEAMITTAGGAELVATGATLDAACVRLVEKVLDGYHRLADEGMDVCALGTQLLEGRTLQ